ncbi:glucose dehydrogenase [FAD, quinone]-like [Macrosteles quadrilineatus]|uniref:glucose dehydrogenase [FAD, quinone]-like n=1 Tax=Macrosteles quadrilineatus TaxID=74068 RepID=UPI0023E29EF7|nr:glucose dehydrogenase [FAD, quinone]-like [Macrosteles quadrilineatus]
MCKKYDEQQADHLEQDRRRISGSTFDIYQRLLSEFGCSLMFFFEQSSGSRPSFPTCSYNPLFLEGTCSAQYTDPAALLIDEVFAALAQADCELADPCDYPPHYSPADWEEFDFIIIGAGSAGSVVANRLSEVSGWSVLLLEAGGDPTKTSEVPSLFFQQLQTNVDWNYKTDPSEPNCLSFEGNRCTWPRGKVLGGSSVINAMIYSRGNPRDYDCWESDGNSGWGFKDVLPYFKKFENMRSCEVRNSLDFLYYHGEFGPLTVEDFNSDLLEPLVSLFGEGFKELGYSYNPDTTGRFQSGFCRIRGTLKDGRRCSTAKAFLSPIIDRSNLKVSKHSLATRILICHDSNTAYGVEFIDRNGDIVRVLARKEVIVSAGAINSPQLLMLSGVGPSTHLNELGIKVIVDLPVGENLQDHAMHYGPILALNYDYNPTANIEKKMFDFLLKYNSPLSSIGLNVVNVFIDTHNMGINYPNIQNYFLVAAKNDSRLEPTLKVLSFTEEVIQQFLEINSESLIVIFQPALLNPYSRGRIRLQSTDPWQYPIITTGYFSDPRDVDTFIEAIEFLERFAQTEPIKAAGARLHDIKVASCSKFPTNSRLHRECILRHLTSTVYHPVGTCKMGPLGRPDAVVDPHLRVQGVANLRVIDASVMPRIVRGNTNAPTIMIAEKGSDHIKQRWFSGRNRV